MSTHTGQSQSPGAPAQGSTEQLREQASQYAGAAKEKVQQMGEQARQFAEENYEQFRDSASEYLEEGKQRALDMQSDLEERIRREPVKSLLIAAGCGLLLGVLLARR